MVQSSDLASDASKQPVSRRQIALVFLAFILIGANDGGFGILIPGIRAYYGVDAATLSWIFLMSVLGYLTASFNNGFLTARLGERRFMLLAFALFILGVGLVSLGLPFVIYLLLAGLLGFGVGMIDAGLNAYVASLPGNTVLLNYLHAFWGLGALLGPLVASLLLNLHLNWQATYLTWLCIALILWIGFWILFRPQQSVQESVETLSVKQQGLFQQTLRLRVVWLAALFLLFYVGTEIGLGNWGYSFLTIARQGPTLFSAWVISGYWLGLTAGRLTLANLVNRLGIRRLIYVCLIGVSGGLLLAWFLPDLWGAALGFCLVGFFLGPIFPTAIALMSQIAPARLLASAVGFLVSLGSTGGALFPSLAGALLQHVGFWFLPPFALILTMLMVVAWLVLGRLSAPQK